MEERITQLEEQIKLLTKRLDYLEYRNFYGHLSFKEKLVEDERWNCIPLEDRRL